MRNNRGIPSLFQELLKFDNVLGVGRGNKMVRGESTGEEAVVVLVRKKYNKSDMRRTAVVPKRIENKPTDVIEVGDIRLLNERTQVMRPARPGVSIGHYQVSAGTFGAVVRDRSTGAPLILSNNHVLANATDGADGRSKIGDAILQPGLFDGGKPETSVIAHLERFVPLNRAVADPQCKVAKTFELLLNKCIEIFRPQYRVRVLRDSDKVNVVDCAVAAPLDEKVIAPEILELGAVVGVKEPSVGMAVKKSGRSTGLTYSIVLATDITIKVDVGNNEYAVFTDQVLAGPMSMPGDSGSLILTEDNYAVGLLFAGSEQATMFNRIDNVLDALNITF